MEKLSSLWRENYKKATSIVLLASVLFLIAKADARALQVSSTMQTFGLDANSTYSVVNGQPTGIGSFKNGKTGEYPEGSCIPVTVNVTNDDTITGNIDLYPSFDYSTTQGQNTIIGIDHLESLTSNVTDPINNATNLNNFTFGNQDLTNTNTFQTLSGLSIIADITGPFLGEGNVNGNGNNGNGNQNTVQKHYLIQLKDVPADETVVVTFCARLGVDASGYNGASLSVRVKEGGNENTPISSDQLLQLPTLTLIKQVSGGTHTADEWAFDVSPAINGQSRFEIPTGSDRIEIPNVTLDGNYSVQEVGPAGYSFQSGTGTNCSFSGNEATATVAAGKPSTDAICTFVNVFNPATITVEKRVINDNGGTAIVSDFPLFINSGSFVSTQVISGVATEVGPGTFRISETESVDYTATFSGDCDSSGDITINFGQHLTCVITNDDIDTTPPTDPGTTTPTSTIIITKQIVNDDGGTSQSESFPVEIDNVAVPSEIQNIVNPGSHIVSVNSLDEQSVGYVATFSGACDVNGNVNINLGENLICIITINDVANNTNTATSTITVTKIVINDNGGTAQVSDFQLSVGKMFYNLPLVSGVSAVIQPGSYVVSESNVGYYTPTISGDCDAQGNITITAGQNLTCTITNNDIATEPETTTTTTDPGTGSGSTGGGSTGGSTGSGSIDGTNNNTTGGGTGQTTSNPPQDSYSGGFILPAPGANQSTPTVDAPAQEVLGEKITDENTNTAPQQEVLGYTTLPEAGIDYKPFVASLLFALGYGFIALGLWRSKKFSAR